MDWKDALASLSGLPEGEESLDNESAESAREENNKQKGAVHVLIEKKGRGGKIATIIVGFSCSDSELRQLASRLKNLLGCGGSCRDGEILLQGNRREDVIPHLRSFGYRI